MLASLLATALLAHPAAIHHRQPVKVYRRHRECHSERCARAADRAWWRVHGRRLARASASMAQALASWYDDSESLACARASDGMGVASLTVPCGARVRLCHTGCVTATVDDHGPYIAGRTFDLNEEVKAAIGCSDLCSVRWSRA